MSRKISNPETVLRYACKPMGRHGPQPSFRLLLSRPLPHVWRLRALRDGDSEDAHGATQQLAAALGESTPERPAPLIVHEDGSISAADSTATARLDGNRLHFEKDGHSVDIGPIELNRGTWTVTGALHKTERLWGTGERFNQLDQRGKRIELWAEDRWCETEGNSYAPLPFLLSSRGYGLLINRYEKMIFDLGATAPDTWRIEDLHAPLDLYVFLAPAPRDILRDLTALCGRPPMPPDWAFGMLVSRHGNTGEFATPQGVRAMADTMDRLDLPWTGAIIEGWPTYDSSRHAELKALVAELHARHKKVMVYEACGRVQDKLTGSLPGMDRILTRERDGNTLLKESDHYNPGDAPDRKTSRFLDITRADARRAWATDVWVPLLKDVGVDGAKIDFCEQFPEHETLALSEACRPEGMHHFYPAFYNVMMHRLYLQHRPDGGLCWSRGGGIGVGRVNFLWCGDQRREFTSLQPMLLAALSAGLSGVPFMGHDMSGYIPARQPDADPEAEVFIRGAQMAAFWPMMSTHGNVTRPYDFAEPIVALYRVWTKIHAALLPYIREQAAACCADGTPFLRALCLHYPDDPVACAVEDQFFMGADLLVAPVLTGAASRDVYLPAGRWRDVNTGAVIEGPARLRAVPAPFQTIPFYAAETPASSALAGCLETVRHLLADA